jgi:hypothetical protein
MGVHPLRIPVNSKSYLELIEGMVTHCGVEHVLVERATLWAQSLCH